MKNVCFLLVIFGKEIIVPGRNYTGRLRPNGVLFQASGAWEVARGSYQLKYMGKENCRFGL